MIEHTKVSAIADGGDATLVRPSDWNAMAFIRNSTNGTTLVPAGHSAYVPETFEVVATDTLEIAATASMEVG